MISLSEFVKYHEDLETMHFRVSDSTRKTDEDLLLLLKKKCRIDDPKSLAKFPKVDRDKILVELKKEFSVRHLQRMTGISRGVITKA